MESRLDDLLKEWERLLYQGQFLPAEELCADCPELTEALDRLIQEAIAARQQQSTACLVQESPDALPSPEGMLCARSRYGQLRYHARGGLGEVFVAEDQNLNRPVALKFIRKPHDKNAEDREQFLVEAEIAARLEHPGVVPVYGLGETDDGRPFLVMRLIRGETFADAIAAFHGDERENRGGAAERDRAFRALLRHFISVCNTVAYAHNRGIVHRDLKPDNIMLGKYGEALVLDWGLALPVERGATARASGEATLRPCSGESGSGSGSGGGTTGTPAFMSPEQAAGSPDVGPASDVFSLGATLYKLLTGQAPFQGIHVREVLARARQAEFRTPRSLRPRAPAALEAVCLKAMARNPQDRYATPLDLAADVEGWLADEPVTAWREPLRQRGARWARRHRGAVTAAAAGGLVLLGVLVVSAVWLGALAGREQEARIAAEQAQAHGLNVSARFAAKSVANEIDLRWRILEGEAGDSDLRALLTRPDEASRLSLQSWLNNRFIEHNETTRATSWFVTDARGVQLARSPPGDSTGQRFHYRDYFHGEGRDLPVDHPVDEVEPISRPHRSVVFESTATGNRIVAFSVPIWSGKAESENRRILGVLAMTVELGRFSVLQLGLGRDQIAVLIDTKTDHIDGAPRSGLVLHHPGLDGAAAQAPEARSTWRVAPELAERFTALRAARLRQPDAAAWGDEPDNVDMHYRDPADGAEDARWQAAFEPVLVRGRPSPIADTGWIVIVQSCGEGRRGRTVPLPPRL